MNLENTYAQLPEHFHAKVRPAASPNPRLLAWNEKLAAELGIGHLGGDTVKLARWFGGNELLPGSEPIALAYAGHQFGSFVPQLGDGRALLLGEVTSKADGRRYDVQLKGSGQTPFSRNGDGKAAIGPVIREYLVSEAMHRMGVPTTRSLAAVATGETVLREGWLPGGVLTRVAASHIRVGTFEYFAVRGDKAALQLLTDFAIARHYPEAGEAESPIVAFFAAVVEAQARLIAHWLDIGFIHGVMNTDNMAISGETIDYGPCAFLDEFDYEKVFSSIDRYGRYAYGQQPSIAVWNLARLAECLMRLGDDKAHFEAQLDSFEGLFHQHYLNRMAAKLGFSSVESGDAQLINEWLQYLQDAQLDYTLSFRRLAQQVDTDAVPQFGEFEQRWKARIARQDEPPHALRARMDAVNPLYIPRNHQIERAIEAAIGGDLSVFNELRQALQQPFSEQPGFAVYAEPPRPEERVLQTFCGT
jgi:uncharacterized protein YdiU (UPF0061 family)